MDKHTIYIGLGSNLDNPELHVSKAIDDIKLINNCDFISSSSLYKTPPMGPQDQPDYINAIVKIQSGISALELLDELQALEQHHHRVRTVRWGARNLDLDIILYGTQEIDSIRLKIPHPGLYVRAFVLYPLLEIEPNLSLPNGATIAAQVESLGEQDIAKLI